MRFSRYRYKEAALIGLATTSQVSGFKLLQPSVDIEFPSISLDHGRISTLSSAPPSNVPINSTLLSTPPSNAPINSTANSTILPPTYQHDPQNSGNFTDPYEAWEHSSIKPLEWWHRTPETTKKSEVTEMYEAFIKSYRDQSTHEARECKKHNFGEFNCFAWTYLGDPNFRCSVDNPQLCRKYSPLEIMGHVNKHWEGHSLEKRANLGRQAYFASEIIHELMAKDHRFYSLVSAMEAYAQSHVTGLVESFTPQVDAKRVANCELAKQLIELTIEAAWLAVQGTCGLMLPGAGGLYAEAFHKFIPDMMQFFDTSIAKAWPKIFEPFAGGDGEQLKYTSTGKKLMYLMKFVMSAQENGYYNRLRNGLGWTIGDIPAADLAEIKEWYKSNGNQDPGVPQMAMMMSTASGMCGNNFGVVVDNNKQHESAVGDFINDFTGNLRGALDKHFKSFFFFKKDDAQSLGSVQAFAAHAALSSADFVHADIQKLEKRMEQSMKEVLISNILAGGRSFMECEERDDASKVCAKKSKKNPNSNDSRYCPPNTNLRCQMARWTKQEVNNHKDFVPGFDSGGFARYNTSAQAILEGSFNHFNQNRKTAYSWQETMTEMGDLRDHHALLHIPVCMTPINTIEEIKPSRNFDLAEKSRWKTKFPFSCGNWRNNESVPFINQVNINLAAEKDMVQTNLAAHLYRIHRSPARAFSLLCKLHVRWPRFHAPYDWRDSLINNDTSTACPSFLGATQHMSEWEANYHICTSPLYSTSIRSGEKGWLINVVPNPINHRRMCRRWVWRNKKLFEERKGGEEEAYAKAVESLKADEAERQQMRENIAELKKVIEEGDVAPEDRKAMLEEVERLEQEVADDSYRGD